MDKESPAAFLTAFFLFALANGLSGSIISNYFKDVFRSIPFSAACWRSRASCPVLWACSSSPRSFARQRLALGSRLRVAASACSCSAFSPPGYFVMQLFVFTYSLGDHMVMPIRDAIAMDLADEGKTGTFLGRYRGMMTLGSMLASTLVFVGFRVGFFLFPAPGSSPRSALRWYSSLLRSPFLPPAENAARAGCAQAQRAQRLPVRRRYLPLLHRHRRLRLPEADAPCLCSMGHHRASLDGRGRGGAARHRRLFLRRLGRPAHRKVFRPTRCAEGSCWSPPASPVVSLRRVGRFRHRERLAARLGRHGRRVRLLILIFPHRPFQFRPRRSCAS